jgi:hypothetical protein
MQISRFFVLILFISSCSLFSGNDKKKDDSCDWPIGNRNYTWRIDTVGYWPSDLGGLYVFNDSTAFITGRVETKNSELLTGLRWNGKAWLTDIYSPSPSYPIGHYGNDATGVDTLMVSVGYWGLKLDQAAIGEFNLKTKTWTKYQFETIGSLNSVWTDGKGYYIAVGDNGVMYSKDSPNSDWVFSRMEDEFNLTKVSGVSKSELYISGYKQPDPRSFAISRIYRILQGQNIKLYDTQNPEQSILKLNKSDEVSRLSVYRCTSTDSLYLAISANTTFKLTSYGHELDFKELNLHEFIPFNTINISSGEVFMSTPNDIWVPTIYYGLYHYNGLNVQKIETIPGLPYGNTNDWGIVRKMVFSKSGKIWMLMETKVQNYILIQGTPN